jgi:hypothetical protein
MNRLFRPAGYFTVPDGTDVSPFLNATDSEQTDVPWGALGDMSIAAGRIKPGTVSRIHMLPLASQVTYLVSGRLQIRMKDSGSSHPYQLDLRPGDAALNGPGTLFQLVNLGSDTAACFTSSRRPTCSRCRTGWCCTTTLCWSRKAGTSSRRPSMTCRPCE